MIAFVAGVVALVLWNWIERREGTGVLPHAEEVDAVPPAMRSASKQVVKGLATAIRVGASGVGNFRVDEIWLERRKMGFFRVGPYSELILKDPIFELFTPLASSKGYWQTLLRYLAERAPGGVPPETVRLERPRLVGLQKGQSAFSLEAARGIWRTKDMAMELHEVRIPIAEGQPFGAEGVAAVWDLNGAQIQVQREANQILLVDLEQGAGG